MIVIISGRACPDLQVNRIAFPQVRCGNQLVQGFIFAVMVMRVRFGTVIIDVDLPVHILGIIRSDNTDPCFLTRDDSGRYIGEIHQNLLSVRCHRNCDHIGIDRILLIRIPYPGKHLISARVAIVVAAGPGITVEVPLIIVMPVDLSPVGPGRIHADPDIFTGLYSGSGHFKSNGVFFRFMDRQPDPVGHPAFIAHLAGSPDAQPVLACRHFRRGERDLIVILILMPVQFIVNLTVTVVCAIPVMMKIVSMLFGVVSNCIVQRHHLSAGHGRFLEIHGEFSDCTGLCYCNPDRIAGHPFPVHPGTDIQGLNSGFIVILFFKDPLAVFVRRYIPDYFIIVLVPVRPEDISVKVLERVDARCADGHSEILIGQNFILADFKRNPFLVPVGHKNVVVLVIVFIPDAVDPYLQLDLITLNNPVTRNCKFQLPLTGIVSSLIFLFIIPVQVEPPSHIAGILRILHAQHKRLTCRRTDRDIRGILPDSAIRRPEGNFHRRRVFMREFFGIRTSFVIV